MEKLTKTPSKYLSNKWNIWQFTEFTGYYDHRGFSLLEPERIKTGRDVVDREVFCLNRFRFSAAVIGVRPVVGSLLEGAVGGLELVVVVLPVSAVLDVGGDFRATLLLIEVLGSTLVAVDAVGVLLRRLVTEEPGVVDDCVARVDLLGKRVCAKRTWDGLRGCIGVGV